MLKFLGVAQPDPKELVRKWQQQLRTEQRGLERQIREIQFEEKKIQKVIKEAAKRGDMASVKHLAKEIVQSRKAVARIYTSKAQMMSVGTALTSQLAMVKVAGTLGKSNEVMKGVSKLMKVPEIQKSMMEMSKEMMKAGLINEMLDESMDAAMDGEDIEEETEAQIEKILAEIAIDTKAMMPSARKATPAKGKAQAAEEEEDEEMAEMKARLAAVKA